MPHIRREDPTQEADVLATTRERLVESLAWHMSETAEVIRDPSTLAAVAKTYEVLAATHGPRKTAR